MVSSDKKVTALIVLSVVAVFSLLYGILTPSKARRGLGVRSGVPQKMAQSLARGKVAVTSAGRTRSAYTAWGDRDPFILPVSKESTGVRLNGIVWDEEAPQAIINGQILGVGDRLDADTVIVDIRQASVIIKNGVEEFELRLRED